MNPRALEPLVVNPDAPEDRFGPVGVRGGLGFQTIEADVTLVEARSAARTPSPPSSRPCDAVRALTSTNAESVERRGLSLSTGASPGVAAFRRELKRGRPRRASPSSLRAWADPNSRPGWRRALPAGRTSRPFHPCSRCQRRVPPSTGRGRGGPRASCRPSPRRSRW